MTAERRKGSRIATIGYEKAGFGDFTATLRGARIEHVLDIRELPLSRRAGFSKRQLMAGLHEAGIDYTHIRALGTPKEGRVAAKAGKMALFRDIFATHMNTETAQNGLREAAVFAQKARCCLLCFEANEEHCHRKVVAEALQAKIGLPIDHLHVALAFGPLTAKRVRPTKIVL